MDNRPKQNRKVLSSVLQTHSSLEKPTPGKPFFSTVKRIPHIFKVLSQKESWAVKMLILIMLLTGIYLIYDWYLDNSILVPAPGGVYIEGMVGSPSLINPLLAQANEVDRDITRLMFNGLLQQENGRLQPDLATSLPEISEDGLTYTFSLRDDVVWHHDKSVDGVPFTAADVLFTIERIQDPEFKSPLFNSLNGVIAHQIDLHTISLTLPEPFAPFQSLLTFGIIPEHLWENVPVPTAHLADLNLKNPVGTGPYKVKNFKKNGLGVITSYSLERNENFYGTTPFIETVTFKFYPDFATAVDALNSENIDGINFLPNKFHADIASKETFVRPLSLPQYTAIFFNPLNNVALKEVNVRKALTHALNRGDILASTLDNEGTVIYGPILPGFIGHDPKIVQYDFNPEEAKKLIAADGWKEITPEEFVLRTTPEPAADLDTLADLEEIEVGIENVTSTEEVQTEPTITQDFFWAKDDEILTITLTTVDNPETARASTLAKKQWEAIGVHVNLIILPHADLLSDVIKPRAYEALLFGQIIGNDPDPYAFWHSSQIEDPGVNLALYSNSTADTLLEDARKTNDSEERGEKYKEFQSLLKEDVPAIFLYNPTYSYVLHPKVHGFTQTRIATPGDRFNNIDEWFIETKRMLK